MRVSTRVMYGGLRTTWGCRASRLMGSLRRITTGQRLCLPDQAPPALAAWPSWIAVSRI